MKSSIIVKVSNLVRMQLGGFAAITRAIADQARTIRIPVHMVETINKLIRVQRQLLQDLGREPSPEEIGEEMDLAPEKYVKS